MIFSFSVLLGLIFILELAGGISGYVLRNDAESLIKDKLRSTMLEYNQTNKLDVAYLWDEVQRDVSTSDCARYFSLLVLFLFHYVKLSY